MTWIQRYAEERSMRDPGFSAAYEEEAALLSLVRAVKVSQNEVAASLQSQHTLPGELPPKL
jgi:hypothetical protein